MTEPPKPKPTPLYDRLTGIIRAIYDWRIDGPPILDLDAYFPGAARFTESWREIRDEALRIAEEPDSVPDMDEVMKEQVSLAAQDGRYWKILIAKAYGVEVPVNLARCPILAALVRATPEVLSASLSFLEPHKHIPRHCGPFRGVLRFHLGLSMPLAPDGRPAAVLTVDDREYRIANGEWLLWDDTYPHEVLNDSDEVRIALLLDVWRRGMPLDMQLLSRLIVAVVQIGMKVRGVSYSG